MIRHFDISTLTGRISVDMSKWKGFRGNQLELLGDQKLHRRPEENGIPAINLDQGCINRTTDAPKVSDTLTIFQPQGARGWG